MILPHGFSGFQNMNPAQLAAASHKDGPAVVYAGAGSGKTRVICARIAWLISEHHISPSAILAVTFTNKAANEMKERIEHFVGEDRCKHMIVSTFHSFCARFLRIYAHEIGYKAGFSIYDDGDQKSLLKELLKKLNVPDKILSVATIKSKIDKLKNQGKSPEDYLKDIQKTDTPEQDRRRTFQSHGEAQYDPMLVQKLYALYQQSLKQQNAMDFNDLLSEMHRLLSEVPKVLEALQNRFRYFLIDEFQDTNPIQFNLIKILSSKEKNLFIVGDDDQSIYSWRGAEPSFILNFHRYFEGASIYKLEQNYRSTKTIIEAAKHVIQNNTTRVPKTIFTNADEGEKIKIKSCEDPYSEAHYIANQIFSRVQSDMNFSQFCILYRTNAQSRSLEDELRRRMVPYVIFGSVRFYERAEIKILLAYLKLLINPFDGAAFEKAINTPKRGIGDTALAKIKALAEEQQYSLLKTAWEIANGNLTNPASRSLSGLKSFVQQYQKWKTLLDNQSKPSVVLSEIIKDIAYESYLHTHYPEDHDDRWLNVIELKNALAEFEQGVFDRNDTIKYLSGIEQISLFIEQAMLTVEPTTFNAKQGEDNAIVLMTIHSAKGLEFQNVFLAGLEEGVLPHQNSINSPDGFAIEEERRLMYVAITRAQKTLTITHCKRNRYKEFLPAQKSRFLDEIPKESKLVFSSLR